MLSDRVREIIGFLLATLISVAATLVLTWPLAENLDQVIIGAGELGGWLWRYDWHFRSLEALMESDLGLFDTWRAFVGLGRYPETGNVLDVLALSYPLQKWFGFPAGYNIKVLLILTLNGTCAYALGRYFSGSIAAALAAAVIAVANPLCLLEVQACGLRQALLWWVLLYPPLLDRALRRRTIETGLVAGACFAIAGAYYWFYGLFAGLFTVVWVIKHAITERDRLDRVGTTRSLISVGVGLILVVLPFILPYALPESGAETSHKNTVNALPEMTFFLSFPSYDTISHAPLRPSTYAENVHASLHRTIGSSWSATYPIDPTLNEGLPLVVALLGLVPALTRRRTWGWLAIWIFFYLGTLGPFLRIGEGDSQNVLVLFDSYVVRMPYAWMFQFIPGMSRMFAPYRLGSFVIVGSVVLVAIGLARMTWRQWIAPFVVAAIVVQPMLRLGRGAINEGDSELKEFRSPFKMNRMTVPDFYKTELDPTVKGGIIELPLDQQQDITCFYQTVHQQKVYKSWASPGSIPPFARQDGTAGVMGEQLRFQARPDVMEGDVPAFFDMLSKSADTADPNVLTTPAFAEWAEAGQYQWIVLHERGFLLVDPARGFYLYESAKLTLSKVLGKPFTEIKEAERGNPANALFGVPLSGELMPWSSQPLKLPREGMPDTYRMAVFKLNLSWSNDAGSEVVPSDPPDAGGDPAAP